MATNNWDGTSSRSSSFLPLALTLTALEVGGHRLIARTHLKLEEVGFIVTTVRADSLSLGSFVFVVGIVCLCDFLRREGRLGDNF